GTKSTTYSAPRYNSVWPRWRPKPLTSVTVIPETPMSDSAARTSSSLNGLMIAVTSFMYELSGGCLCPALWGGLPSSRQVRFCSFHATQGNSATAGVAVLGAAASPPAPLWRNCPVPALTGGAAPVAATLSSRSVRANRHCGRRPGGGASRRHSAAQGLYRDARTDRRGALAAVSTAAALEEVPRWLTRARAAVAPAGALLRI